MEVRITTLTENTAPFGFLAEWGFSALIETDGGRVLLDTGMSTTATQNAQLLGIDFSGLDAIVLSHGHVDHTGGLRDVLRCSGPVQVIGHPDVFTAKYARREGQPDRYIGIPFRKEDLDSLGASFTLRHEPMWISPKIVTTGEVPMMTSYECIDAGLYHRTEAGLEPDPIADDLSLAVMTEEGMVVIMGCAHRGPVNVISRLREITGEDRVYAVVGGTHLVRASEERIQETIREFKAMGVRKVACSHCTGLRASARMMDAFGDGFVLNHAGNVLTFPAE